MMITNSVDQPEPVSVRELRAETAEFLTRTSVGNRSPIGDLMRRTADSLTRTRS